MKLHQLLTATALGVGLMTCVQAADETLRFIACPIYRDTDFGRKSGCWLAEDAARGVRFDLQQAHTKPQLGHEVLVEGVRPDANRRRTQDCGGEVLERVRVSVLPGRCASAVLPAEGHPGTRFVLPGSVMTANHEAQPMPSPPWATRTFSILFDHGQDYLIYQHAEVPLQEAVRLARLGGARAIRVQGFAATQPQTVSGRVLAEPAALAQDRAHMAEEALVRLGWPRALIQTQRDAPAATPAGAAGAAALHPLLAAVQQRRVDITVEIAAKPAATPAAIPAATSGATPAARPAETATATNAPQALVSDTSPTPPWQPNQQPVGSGPYPAVMEMVPGLPHHTVYRPADLNAAGLPALPVVAWANGACLNVGNRFRWFLSEIASHGFIVIALGPLGPREVESQASVAGLRGRPAPGSPAALAGPGVASAAAAAPPQAGAPRPDTRAETSPAQLTQAIDWALAAHQRVGSPWQGRINTQQIAVMGQSCGGLQAIAATAADPRVRTLGVWNSGVLDDAVLASSIAGAPAAEPVNKALLARIRVPSIYITGDASDVAYPNADDDFLRLQGVPVLRAWRAHTGHSGTYREAGGGAFGSVAVDWLRWQLQGDAQAGKRFTGPNCGLCREPGWTVQRKGLD